MGSKLETARGRLSLCDASNKAAFNQQSVRNIRHAERQFQLSKKVQRSLRNDEKKRRLSDQNF